jgi:hypothetical protein
VTGWSADGNWFWDGAKWNDAISADGRWRFDGQAWHPFTGVRSAMPAPPAPAVVEEPAPSWLAPSEVERMRNEKVARETAAAVAAASSAAPLPKELDWRYVGQTMERHQSQPQYADWQVGALSVAIFIVLWLFCVPASLYFVWKSGWRTSSKLIVASIAFAVPLVIGLIRLELAIQRLQ